jgi:hypothetical protein
MSQETTDNFWQAFKDFRWPDPPKISYRLYHDDQGVPLLYSMDDLPGTYIEVDQETYVISSHAVRVVNGSIIKLEPKSTVTKLKPGSPGVPCDPRDVCVVVEPQRPNQQWRLSGNETN